MKFSKDNVTTFLLVVLLIAACVAIYVRKSNCEDRGGTLVRKMWVGTLCIADTTEVK